MFIDYFDLIWFWITNTFLLTSKLILERCVLWSGLVYIKDKDFKIKSDHFV